MHESFIKQYTIYIYVLGKSVASLNYMLNAEQAVRTCNKIV
jgi:hypothetical protein